MTRGRKKFMGQVVRAAALAIGSAIVFVPSSFAATDADLSCRPKANHQPSQLCDSSRFAFFCLKQKESCDTSWGYQCAKIPSDCVAGAEAFPLQGAALRAAVDCGVPGKPACPPTTPPCTAPAPAGGTPAGGSPPPGLQPQGVQAQGTQPAGGILDPSSNAIKQVLADPKNQQLRDDIKNYKTADGQPGNAYADPNIQARINDAEIQQTVDANAVAKAAADKAKSADGSKDSSADDAKALKDAQDEEANSERDLKNANGGTSSSTKTARSGTGGPCSVSGTLDKGGKYNCDGTQTLITTAQAMNQAGQIAGSITTQITGASATQSALNSGTQSAAIQGAADTQRMAGRSQLAVGAVGMVMGMMQMQRASRHSGYAKDINQQLGDRTNVYESEANENSNKAAWKDTQGVAQSAFNYNGTVIGATSRAEADIDEKQKAYQKALTASREAAVGPAANIAKFKLQTAKNELQAAVARASKSVSSAGQSVGQDAAGEQNSISQKARDGGMFSMLQAAQQITQGSLSLAAAGQLDQAAAQMAANQGVTIAPPGQDTFPTQDPRAPTSITGAGAPANAAGASQDQQPTDNGVPPLGTGLPPPQAGGVVGDPGKVGGFTGAGPTAAAPAGGGGGGLTGGSTTPPAPDATTEKGPLAASNTIRDAIPISGGAGFVGPMQPGKENALNPADVMAAAMGGLFKKDDPTNPSSQAYGGSGRFPASETSLSGFSMPDANLFKIVEEGYRRSSHWESH
jgi:hypothetical protein